MSRLNTQTRLNDGPRTLDVPRSFLVNPQRVFSRSTQDIGGLLRQLGGTAVSLQVSARSRQAQDDQEEFVSTMNSLAEKKGAFDRNEITSAELLQDYDAARERYTDPQQQARLIAFAEPFKTSLVEQTEKRQTSATAGFIDTKIRELAYGLANDSEFVSEIVDLPYAQQLEAIRGEFNTVIPEDMQRIIDEDDTLQAGITTHVLSVARSSQQMRSQILREEERRVQQYAVASHLTSILNGGDVTTEVQSLVAEGIPEEDVWSGLSDSITGNITAALEAGSMVDTTRYLSTAQDILSRIPSVYGKERGDVGKAIAIGIGRIGETSATVLTNAVDIARLSGATPEEIQGVITDQALQTAETILGQEFPTREEFLAYLPDNTSQGKVHEELARVMKDVEVQEAERTKTIHDAVTSTLDIDNAAPSTVTSPLRMGPTDLSQYLEEASQQLVESGASPEVLGMLEAAKTDRAALVQFLTANSNNTSHAGRIAAAVGDEHLSTDTVSQEGLRQVIAAVEGLGSGDDIKLVTGTDSWDKRYALGKAYAAYAVTGQVDENIYNQELALYNQSQFETKSGERQSLATALQDQKVFKAITGASEGQFTDQQLALLLQTMNISSLKETGGKRDTAYISHKAKQALSKSGVYIVTSPSQNGGRSLVGLTQSKAVPEAIGQTTEQVERGLNNPGSTVDRFLATTIGGAEAKSLWSLALDRTVSNLPEDSPMREALTRKALDEARNKGKARIIVNSLQADRTTPIYLELGDGGSQNRLFLIGEINFSEDGVRTTFSNYSSKAFLSPEDLKEARPLKYSNIPTIDGQFFEGGIESSSQFQGP